MNKNHKISATHLTIHYAFVQGSFWICFCITNGFAAVFLKSKNFSDMQIGLVLALACVISVILQPAIAAFADKTDKMSLKFITCLAILFSFILSIALYPVSNTFLLTAVLYLLICTLQLTIAPLINSLALEYINSDIPVNYGLSRGIGSVSFAAASYLLGLWLEKSGVKILAFSYFIVCLSMFFLTLTLPVLKHTPKTSRNSSSGILDFIKKYRKFTISLIGISLLFTQHNMLNTYLVKIMENVGGDKSDFGLSLSIAAVLELPTMACFSYLVKKIKCSSLLRFSAVFFTIKAVIAWLAPNVFMVHVSQAFQMLAYALFLPASVYYVNEIMEEQDKVKGQALAGAASMGIGGALGNLMSGKLLSIAGVNKMLFIGIIFSLAGCIILFFAVADNTQTQIQSDKRRHL